MNSYKTNGSKEEPDIVLCRKLNWTSQHRTRYMNTKLDKMSNMNPTKTGVNLGAPEGWANLASLVSGDRRATLVTNPMTSQESGAQRVGIVTRKYKRGHL